MRSAKYPKPMHSPFHSIHPLSCVCRLHPSNLVYMLDSPIKLKTYLLFWNCIKSFAYDVYDDFKLESDKAEIYCEVLSSDVMGSGFFHLRYVCQSSNNLVRCSCMDLASSAWYWLRLYAFFWQKRLGRSSFRFKIQRQSNSQPKCFEFNKIIFSISISCSLLNCFLFTLYAIRMNLENHSSNSLGNITKSI